MTAEEQAELDRMRTHCAMQGLNLFFIWAEVPDAFATEEMEQAG